MSYQRASLYLAGLGETEFRFARRRYGRKMFTWAEAFIRGQWVSLGDPWPGAKVARAELSHAVTLLAIDGKLPPQVFAHRLHDEQTV